MDENKRLALRLKKHDERAFDRIMLKYTPLVSSIIHNISDGKLSKEDIEEATADTFVSLWKNVGSFDPDKLTGYLCAIAKSKALDYLKKRRIVPVDIDEVDIEDDHSLEEGAETKELVNELKKAVDKLGEPEREILIRYYFYYQKIEDISAYMKINPATVKVKLHRTRKKLKAILTERGFSL